jgi:hypothetical protein
MALRLTRDIVVRSKFLTRKNEKTGEIISVIAPNGLQIGLSGSDSVTSEFKSYGNSHFYSGLSGSLTRLTDGTSYLIAGSNVTITSASNGAVTISHADATGNPGGSTTQVQFNDDGAFGGNADFIFNKVTGDVKIGGVAGTSELQFRAQTQKIYSPLADTLAIDATNQVQILSGGAVTSFNEAGGNDVSFYVSGSVGSKDSSDRGTAVFGGDMVVSGGMYINLSSNAAADFRVETDGEDEALFIDASSNTLFINRGATSFITIVKNTADEVLAVKSQGLVINENGNSTVNTRIETNNKTHAVFVDAGTDQVLILSGGAAASANESTGTDVAFYVSGSRESAFTSVRGTSLFGGDLITSGNIGLVSNDPDTAYSPAMTFRRISASPEDGDELGRISFQGRNDADELITYSRMTAEINDASNGSEDGVIIFEVQRNGTARSALELKNNEAVFNNGAQDINFRIESDTDTYAFFMDAGNNYFALGQASPGAPAGSDAFLTVSGSIGKKGTVDDYSVVALRGDTHVSGSLYVSGTAPSATTMPKFSVGCSPTTPPKTALDVTYDYTTHTFENQLADGEGGGQRLLYGVFTGTTAAGDLCYLSTGAAWINAAANATATSGSLMGIALDADGGADEGLVLLRGFAKIPSSIINGTPTIGLPMYASNDTAGEIDTALPSTSADVVRIVGYCVDTDSSDVLLYFDPDKTWVTVA